MPNVLVTGCAGFLGSALTRRLLALEYDVVGLDRFSEYYDPVIKRRNVAPLLSHPRFRLIEGDLSVLHLGDLGTGYDQVFHLAGQPGVRPSWGSDFDVYLRDNILATQRLLEWVVTLPTLPRLVFASSSSVYGESEQYPTAETVLPRPVSPYGVSKLAAEHLALLYGHSFGLPVVALRYFTVYGPSQRPDMAFHRFIQAACTGMPIVIYGDGEQTRDFTFVDDIVEANLRAGWHAAATGVFNIGGGQQTSINQVITALESILGRRLVTVHLPPQQGDVRHTGADTTRARTMLGFAPRTTLRDGLAKEVAWLNDERINAPSV